ncbi:sodium/hydrogen exchanger 10 [Sigmodon hispidus]
MEEIAENLTTTQSVKLSSAWLDLLKSVFLSTPEDLPQVILILSLICTIGAFLNMHLKDFPIPLPVILFLIGCCFEILSFASTQIQVYADAIQWMDPDMFFGIFMPVIIFNVAFDMDIYMLHKLLWQIVLITVPGFVINYTLILWYLQSVNKLSLKTVPWLLFSAVLISSDPMLTSASIRDLGLSRSLTNLINGESLMTSVISLIIYSGVVNINFKLKHMNHTLAHNVVSTVWSYLIESFLFGILNTKLIQLWMSTIFGDDVNHIILIFSVLYLIFYICLRDVTSTKHKSVYYTFKHFQELTKSTAMALKFDKDLANADWNMVEKAIALQNPYALNQEETTEHQKVKCPDCSKEIDETLNIEAMELANRRLLSAQIASYQRQYRNEILSQSAVQVLVGAAGSFGEKKGEYMSPENIKNYSESKKLLSFIRKLLLNWVYNTKKDKGVPSRYFFLHACYKIVFTDEFEYIGYLAVLMSVYPMIICWISRLKDIYNYEIKCANYYFLSFYTLEALLKMAAMRKEFFSHTWLLLELGITLVGIIDVILIETYSSSYNFDLTDTVVFMNIVRLLRILRILKLITPKLLQIIDKRMSYQISFRYAILKGYVQGEMDVLNIIDQIASSKQAKQILLRQVMRNMERAMKELGYLEYDHPEIVVTMKTKEEINVMLNMAREIVKAFRSKGIIHKMEGTEINKLIMAKKIEVLELQSVIQPLNIEESPYHIPWLSKDPEAIRFIQEKAKVVTFDCGNNIFEEGDEPEGIYVIISGMVKLKRSKPQLEMERVPSESDVKTYPPLLYTEYLLSGEIIGELNCLTKEPMQYSATCKTVVETYFIPIDHLYEAFEKQFPNMKHKMWQKIGLAITAQKIREHLSFEWVLNDRKIKYLQIMVPGLSSALSAAATSSP